MFKRFFILLLLCSAASASVTVRAKLTDGTGTVSKTAFLRFQLQNCGQNLPEDPTLGVSTVQTDFDLRPNQSDGSILYTNLISNDDIKCGNVASTYWSITLMKDQTHPLRDAMGYMLHNGDTFDPSVTQPMAQFPPAPPTSPLCCGNNQPPPPVSPCQVNSILPDGTNTVVKYVNGPCAQLGPSTGIDDGVNPTQWPDGVTVRFNAFYRTMANGLAGTALNLLVEADATGSAQTASLSSQKVRGVADDGAGMGATQVDVAIGGVHSCLFDNQTAINDFVIASATNPGYCDDAGSTRPVGPEIIGIAESVNTGVGTLAKISLFPGDTQAPGSTGSVTAQVCSTVGGLAYYISTILIGCDPLSGTDGAGNLFMQSAAFRGTVNGFTYYTTTGSDPALNAPNSWYFIAPASGTFSSVGEHLPSTLAPADFEVLCQASHSGSTGTLGWCLNGAANAAPPLFAVQTNTPLGTFAGFSTFLWDGTTITLPGLTTITSPGADKTNVTIPNAANAEILIGDAASTAFLQLTPDNPGGAGFVFLNGTDAAGTKGANLQFSVSSASHMGHTFSNGGGFLLNGPASAGIGVDGSTGDVYVHSLFDLNLTASLPVCTDTNKQLVTSGCTAGSGTVTSVSQVNPTGILSQSGGPVVGAGTFTWVWAGTSGGIACFNTTTSMASSALLTQHGLVIGGGAGACPYTLASLGTTTTVLHGNASGDPSYGPVATNDISNNAVTSAKMAVVNTYRTCPFFIGADNGTALANSDIAPQTEACQIPYAATVVEIDVVADAGTPSVVPAIRHCTANPCASNWTVTDLVSGALSTAASGGTGCSKTGATAGVDTFTTCAATLQNTSILPGDWIETHTATAGGTAKKMSIMVHYTVN